MKVIGMNLAWIVVKDLEAAITFYTDVVGLTLREKSLEHHWAELSGPDGFTLGLAQESSHMELRAGSNAVVTITVEDIVVAKNFYLKKGAKMLGDIIEVPGHVKMQTFIDKDGNTLQLVQLLS